eukprot:COSAG06_NODE_13754_length_1222_cov_20.349955_3_plen_85_part_00
MTHSALEANRAAVLSATPRHTERGNSMHTNGIAACIARDRERETDPSALEQETYALSSPKRRAHTHTPIPPVQQHSSQPYDRVR